MRKREIQNGFSDEELLTRSSTGDAAAFTALYQRRQGCIYRFALQMSGAPDVAEEVTQDVFSGESGRVVRVQMQRTALGAFGFPVNEERITERIPADVLLGDDGSARAVRFVRVSRFR